MLLRAKNWAWLINHVAGDRAAPSVLIMILICCNRVLNLTGDFRGGPLQAPLYPLKPGVSRGLPGLSGGLRGTGPLGPLVIWPLILAVCMPAYVGQSVYHYPVLYQSTRTYRKHSFTTYRLYSNFNTKQTALWNHRQQRAMNTSCICQYWRVSCVCRHGMITNWRGTEVITADWRK